MPTIITPQRDLSTKYQVIFEVTENSIYPTIALAIQTASPLSNIYTDILDPYKLQGGLNYFKVDIGPILDKVIGYIPFSLGLSLPYTYDDEYNVVFASEIADTSQTNKYYKHRKPFYEYWHFASLSAGGVGIPAVQLLPQNLTCYSDGTMATMLQVFTVDAIETLEVTWHFDDAGDSNEDFDLTAPLDPKKFQLNVGLDELFAASVLLTPDRKEHITGYTLATDTGTMFHEVTIVRIDHCKQEPFSIAYVNEWGLWESLVVPSVSREIHSPRKQAYRRTAEIIPSTIGSFDGGELLTPVYNYDYQTVLNVVTDYIDQGQLEQWKYAATCDLVYLKIAIREGSGVGYYHVPVNILNNQVQMYSRFRDKMYNIEMELEFQPLNK